MLVERELTIQDFEDSLELKFRYAVILVCLLVYMIGIVFVFGSEHSSTMHLFSPLCNSFLCLTIHSILQQTSRLSGPSRADTTTQAQLCFQIQGIVFVEIPSELLLLGRCSTHTGLRIDLPAYILSTYSLFVDFHLIVFGFHQDYTPAVFRAVRALSNIDEADYMLSLAGEQHKEVLFFCSNAYMMRHYVVFYLHVASFHAVFINLFLLQATSTTLNSSPIANPDSSFSTRTMAVT